MATTVTVNEVRITCYYFYLWDEDFGPGLVKICAYFPYPAKIWVNGHEWAKRQAAHAGIGFTELWPKCPWEPEAYPHASPGSQSSTRFRGPVGSARSRD